MSFHSETHADGSNDQRGIVGRGQDQEQQVQLLALRAGPRLDQKRRRPCAVRSNRFFIGCSALRSVSARYRSPSVRSWRC